MGFKVNGNINVTGNITGPNGNAGVYLTLTDNDLEICGYSGVSGSFKYQTGPTVTRVLEFKNGILIDERSTY